MTSRRIALLLIGGLLLIGAGDAGAEQADCKAQLLQQDAQCQALAEKLATACPSGTNIKETAQCRDLSSQIANTCTRKPCAPPPRKGRNAKSTKGMGGAGMSGTGMGGMGMGEPRSKPAKKAASKTQ
jgi:hypothetical protein